MPDEQCEICKSNMPDGARKCPICQEWQPGQAPTARRIGRWLIQMAPWFTAFCGVLVACATAILNNMGQMELKRLDVEHKARLQEAEAKTAPNCSAWNSTRRKRRAKRRCSGT